MVSNYYEMLGLATDANTADIHRAVDNRYNEMRQLATHPDATVVEEANRNLRLLEQMRATLTDASRRAAYDAGIGVGGAGGLADPAAILRKATPPPPPRLTTPTQAGAPADLWDCPNCSTPNPEWTPFCLKCRTPLLRQCPECGQMKSLVKTVACGNCGFSFDEATRRAALNSEINTLRAQVSTHQANMTKMAENLGRTGDLMFAITYTVLITVSLVIFFLFASLDIHPLVRILLALVSLGGGLFVAGYFRRSYRATKLNIANEQAAVVQAEQRIQELQEAHTSLGARKHL